MKVKEFRVVGPPGTGKTTYIKRQIENAAESYGASQIVVCSLTRAAAAQVASVSPNIPEENIGTLHSFAFRAVGAGNIAETMIEKWNAYCNENSFPALKLSKQSIANKQDGLYEAEEIPTAETEGDRALADSARNRARMLPVESWKASVQSFYRAWCAFKDEADCLDFTDLLEIALRDCAECPGKPLIFLADESQDFSRLAFNLARKWGEQCLRFVSVGDPDQILYQWAGVDPQSFFEKELPKDQWRVLSQSYRVPIAVHGLAMRWIEQTPQRVKIDYLPRQFEGEVRRNVSATFEIPDAAIRDCKRYIEDGKSVMFAASCSYMLFPLIKALRDSGLPFHNPYRTKRGDWNPLNRTGTTATDRLLAYCAPNVDLLGDQAHFWTHAEVNKFVDWLDAKKGLVRGAKKKALMLSSANPEAEISEDVLLSMFAEQSREGLLSLKPEWLLEMVSEDRRRKLEYPYRIISKNGINALKQSPQIIVTTIHAVKGGEADVVYLFPDISPQAMNQWLCVGPGREEIRRTFYVGITRARETLVLLKPAGRMAVNI